MLDAGWIINKLTDNTGYCFILMRTSFTWWNSPPMKKASWQPQTLLKHASECPTESWDSHQQTSLAGQSVATAKVQDIYGLDWENFPYC